MIISFESNFCNLCCCLVTVVVIFVVVVVVVVVSKVPPMKVHVERALSNLLLKVSKL